MGDFFRSDAYFILTLLKEIAAFLSKIELFLLRKQGKPLQIRAFYVRVFLSWVAGGDRLP